MEQEIQLLQDRNERLEEEIIDLLNKLKLANEKIIGLEEENKKLKTEKEETSEAITNLGKKMVDNNLDFCERQFKNEMEKCEDEKARKIYHGLKEKGLTEREIMILALEEKNETEAEIEKKYGDIMAQTEQTPK